MSHISLTNLKNVNSDKSLCPCVFYCVEEWPLGFWKELQDLLMNREKKGLWKEEIKAALEHCVFKLDTLTKCSNSSDWYKSNPSPQGEHLQHLRCLKCRIMGKFWILNIYLILSPLPQPPFSSSFSWSLGKNGYGFI